MEKVHVREANGEVVVFLEKHMGDRLHAINEAIRILEEESKRERTIAHRGPDRTT